MHNVYKFHPGNRIYDFDSIDRNSTWWLRLMGLVQSFRVNNQTILVRPFDATSSLVFIDGYANGVFKGDNAWSTIKPMTQPSQPGSVGPSDPTSFDDIVIEIPNMTIQNVGPQDITASASLADVYNAGQSINGRWAVQSCRPAVNTNGQIILTMHIGANDSDGYIFGIFLIRICYQSKKDIFVCQSLDLSCFELSPSPLLSNGSNCSNGIFPISDGFVHLSNISSGFNSLTVVCWLNMVLF